MSAALTTLLAVMVTGMLLRAPIAFAMLASGIAYLIVKGQDLGLAAEQVLMVSTTATCCWPCRCLCWLPT